MLLSGKDLDRMPKSIVLKRVEQIAEMLSGGETQTALSRGQWEVPAWAGDFSTDCLLFLHSLSSPLLTVGVSLAV